MTHCLSCWCFSFVAMIFHYVSGYYYYNNTTCDMCVLVHQSVLPMLQLLPLQWGLPGVKIWQDELPPPPLIPVDIMRNVTGLTAVQQQQSLSEMRPQDRLPVVTQAYYATFSIWPPQVSFSISVLHFAPIFLYLTFCYEVSTFCWEKCGFRWDLNLCLSHSRWVP